MIPRPARASLAALGLLAAAAGGAGAQEPAAPRDTLARRGEIVPAADVTPPISPWGAFWRSLVLPGWGQSELGSHTRGAVYFAAEGTSLWMWVRTQRRLDYARRRVLEDDPLVQSRKQQREDWITLTVFWAFFNAADAWVSAHLYGFEAKPIPIPGEPAGLFVGWSLPVGRFR